MAINNVELVNRVWGLLGDAWKSSDAARRTAAIDELIDFYDQEVVLDFSRLAGWPEASRYEGKDGLRVFFTTWFDAWETATFDIELIEPAGDQVASVVVQRGSGSASGVGVEWRTAWLTTLRDGKLFRVEAFNDLHEALSAASTAK
jgi:ketosteroid isomerase-like protein